MKTAYTEAVGLANEWFADGLKPLGAPLVRRTVDAHRRARFAFRYLRFEVRIELRNTVESPNHFVFWAAIATGPFHARVRTLVDEIVGPGPNFVPTLGQAMNLLRLALLDERVVAAAERRVHGAFGLPREPSR